VQQISVDRDGPLAIITITLPKHYMTDDTVTELSAVTEQLEADDGCRALIFTGGQENVFVRHFDVKLLEAMSDNLRARGKSFSTDKLLTRDRDIDVLFRRLETMPKITIAAINGYAMGGGFEFCLACDVRIAQAGDYHLGQPEINIGILPGAGGTQRLTRIVGRARAMDLALNGRTVTPEEAMRFGMIQEVTEGPVLDRACELARQYAAKSPRAFAHIKKLIGAALEEPVEHGYAMEKTLFLDLLVGDEASSLIKDMNANDRDIRDMSAPPNPSG
jgi:enoyl-CoA hydratase